jgi:hypothetical protein
MQGKQTPFSDGTVFGHYIPHNLTLAVVHDERRRFHFVLFMPVQSRMNR